MTSTITILCENTAGRSGIIGEHGFSVLIERGNEKYLFDTGPGLSLPVNLKALKKDFKGLKQILLSHGHYDHTGGLKWALEQVGTVEVTAHPALFSSHMVHDPLERQAPPRYIGCPTPREELEKLGAVFRFLDHTAEVRPGLWFVTGVTADPRKGPTDSRLVVLENDVLSPDPLDDDASLLLETDGAPVLILGCAHRGLIPILDHIGDMSGIKKLRAVLGGTHLMFLDPGDIPGVIERLEDFSVDLVGVSHCTGLRAGIELAKHFGGRFTFASAGSAFTF